MRKKYDLLSVIIAIIVIGIVIISILIYNEINKKNNIDNSIPMEFLVLGDYDNIGCLSVYIDDVDKNHEYSFDSGDNWQKSNYGAIYKNGKTTILARDKNKDIFFKKEVNVTSILVNAPVIKVDFDKEVDGVTDKDLLKDISATIGKDNINSKVKVNILDNVDDEVLVSYALDVNGKRCYLVRNATIKEIPPTPTPTSLPVTPTPVSSTPTSTPKSTTTPTPTSSTDNKWVWPTPKKYSISQGFNASKHKGIDIYGPKRGSAIYAARDGVVYDINHNSSSGYYVTLKHDKYYTRYGHMQNVNGNDKISSKGSATKYIKKGQTVKAGDQIGEMGSSGKSTGVHLHFEIWDGVPFRSKAYNPLNFYK